MIMRPISFILLSLILISVVYGFFGARITNESLGLALMVLLLSVFSDLKKFNFWGLIGEKTEEKQLKQLEGKTALDEKAVPRPKQKDVLKAETVVEEEAQPLQLMDTDRGNFLAVAFDLERLLRIAATVLLGKEVLPNTNPTKVLKILKGKGLLTEDGVRQIESVRRLRNMLVQGRDNEITNSMIESGLQIVSGLYTELSDWLKSPR